MKYISSFIHVATNCGQAAIDVNAITSVIGYGDSYKCTVMTANTSPIEVEMKRDKFIDMVEDKRRELWMNERTSQIESSKLMIDLIETVNSLKGPEPDPLKTIEEAKLVHLGGMVAG